MTQIDTLLKEKIDITEKMEEKANNIYNETSEFLSKRLEKYEPEIFPQGSFNLKTIIRPLTGDDFDLDFVCQLNLTPSDINQNNLYKLLGDTLKQNFNEAQLEPKKRCWRVNFNNFHVDILPAIPDPNNNSLLIPDKKLNAWQSTNPKTYASWFNSKNMMTSERNAISNSIQAIPSQNKALTLQKVVKLMKYHRNVMFQNDLENKPISMILTTLAALNYDGTQSISDALIKVCCRIKAMAPDILKNNKLLNPVDNKENFADAWNTHPKRKENFRIWVDKLDDLSNRYSKLIIQNNKDELSKLFLEHFGYTVNSENICKITNIHHINNPSGQWYK